MTTLEAVRQHHALGLRDIEIANLLGRSRERVRQCRVKLGLPRIKASGKCVHCGARLEGRRLTSCSQCKAQRAAPRVITTCAFCGKGRMRKASEVRRRQRSFCDKKCQGHWLFQTYGGFIDHHPWIPKYFCPICGSGAKVQFGSTRNGAYYRTLICVSCGHKFHLNTKRARGEANGREG